MITFKQYCEQLEDVKCFDVIFEDSFPRLAAFAATHTVSDDDIKIAFRKLSIKNYNEFVSNKKVNEKLSTFASIDSNAREKYQGKMLCGWPLFHQYFETHVKTSGVIIDHLFLDFDMEAVKDIQKPLHPLSQEHGKQPFQKHQQQIEFYREQHKPTGMLYYHPSGQGVTEYLVDNAEHFSNKIKSINVHCASEPNAVIMIKLLNDAGYSAMRYSSEEGKQTGFIII